MDPNIVIKNSNDSDETNSSKKNCFLSSVQKYESEWIFITRNLSTDPRLEHLRKIAIAGDLKSYNFRSVCWSLMLRILTGESDTWIQQKREQRKRYQALKDHFCLNPHSIKDINDDPLSQNDESVWNQHFCDQELCAVITQDVVRTFPGIEFFRRPQIQEIMKNILFCYARENPIMCYRQGMHEILAPILFVHHSDQLSYLHYKELNKTSEPILEDVLNPEQLENDSFTIFSHIMLEIESYYRINDLIPTSTGYFPSPASAPQSPRHIKPNRSEIVVVDQLNLIRENILAKEDPQLYKHLSQLDIPLPLFGIRWLRLLFGREFQLQDLLNLWDAIFAEGDHLNLTNFIVVAMLFKIRDKLLSSDYTTCLTLLMKYPSDIEISSIIRHALHMKTPKKYERPLDAFLSVTQSPLKVPTTTSPLHTAKQASTTLPRNYKTMQPSTSSQLNHERVRASMARVNGINSVSARAAIQIAAQNHNLGEQDPEIIDGYMENDPEVVGVALQHAHTIMSLSRKKLIQYLSVLRKNIPGNSVDEIHQALDGIEELCSLLKSRYNTPYRTPGPVEAALEADEVAQKKKSAQRDSDNFVLVNRPETKYEKPEDGLTRVTNILGYNRQFELKELETKDNLPGNKNSDLPVSDPTMSRFDE